MSWASLNGWEDAKRGLALCITGPGYTEQKVRGTLIHVVNLVQNSREESNTPNNAFSASPCNYCCFMAALCRWVYCIPITSWSNNTSTNPTTTTAIDRVSSELSKRPVFLQHGYEGAGKLGKRNEIFAFMWKSIEDSASEIHQSRNYLDFWNEPPGTIYWLAIINNVSSCFL